MSKKCQNCRHHVSVHMYKPDPKGRTDQGPQDCRIPGCGCKEFVYPPRPKEVDMSQGPGFTPKAIREKPPIVAQEPSIEQRIGDRAEAFFLACDSCDEIEDKIRDLQKALDKRRAEKEKAYEALYALATDYGKSFVVPRGDESMIVKMDEHPRDGKLITIDIVPTIER